MQTFQVGGVFETIGTAYGTPLFFNNVDDLCFGIVVNSDYPLVQFLQQHAGPYNFQIIDSAGAIYCPRTLVNADLAIDLSINESECVLAQGQPLIKYTRVDPLSLPFEVLIQYIDPDRNYAVNAQSAKHLGATVQNAKLTAPISFVISADQARALAYDYLYRIWGQTLTIELEHPNLQPEPGDVILLITDISNSGTHIGLVLESTITKNRTNKLKLKALLTTTGITVASGQAAGFGQWSATGSQVSATFSGSGSLRVGTVHNPPAWSTFTGRGSLSASAVGSASTQASAKLSGSGSLKASTVQAALGANLSGSGSLRVSTSIGAKFASGQFAGAGSLSVDAAGVRRGAALNGSGSLIADPILHNKVASASLAGSGSLDCTATSGGGGVLQATATLPGSGALTSDAMARDNLATRILSGTGSLAVGTIQSNSTVATLSGAGNLSVDTTYGLAASGEFDGAGSLSADSTQQSSIQFGSASFSGSGSITTSTTATFLTAATAGGSGGLYDNAPTQPSRSPNIVSQSGTPNLWTNAFNFGPGLPGSRVAGNVLIAWILLNSGGQTITLSGAGWNLGDSNGQSAWAWRTVDGSEAAPSFAWQSLRSGQAACIQIGGADGGSPIGTTRNNSGTSTNLNVLSIATTRNLSMILGLLFTHADDELIPLPTNFSSLRSDNEGSVRGSDQICYQSVKTSGSSSDSMSVPINNVLWSGYLIEILYGATARLPATSTLSAHATFGVINASARLPATGSLGLGTDVFGVKLLLHAEGVDGSTSFVDSSVYNRAVTVNGAATISTTQAKFGSSSASFTNVAGQRLAVDGDSDLAFGSGDFTIDFWVWVTAHFTSNVQLYDGRVSASSAFTPTIYIPNPFSHTVRYLTNGADRIIGTTVLTTGQWHHIAVTRQGTSTRLFLDGTQEGSTFTDSAVYTNATARPSIGNYGGDNVTNNCLNGFMDEVRVVKGTALWTADFTPPTAPYSSPDITVRDNAAAASEMDGAGGMSADSVIV